MKSIHTVVIGSGPGGYVCALRLGLRGIPTLLIEREHVGGVCLNWGCIPSKAFIAAANLFHRIKKASVFGIKVSAESVDWSELKSHKIRVVKKLTGGIEQLLKANKVEVLLGDASFLSPKTLRVKNSQGQTDISFENAVIATGCRPIELPAFPVNGTDIVHSKHIFDLPTLPRRLVVLGGGVIGIELSLVFRRLGCDVTVLEMAPSILPGQDPDIVKALSKSLEKEGLRLLTQTVAQKLDREKGTLKITVTAADGKNQTLEADLILSAVGMRPNTETLNLSAAQVEIDKKGFIKTSPQKETSQKHIYAIGDVSGPPLLAHKASHEGLHVAEHIAQQPPLPLPRAIPGAIFTDPEIASVGLTEAEARASFAEVHTSVFPFAALGKSIATHETDGFVKIIGDKATQRLLGVHIYGHEASNLISEAALALEMDARVEDFALTVHPHPTLSEALMEGADLYLGQAVHVPNRKR